MQSWDHTVSLYLTAELKHGIRSQDEGAKHTHLNRNRSSRRWRPGMVGHHTLLTSGLGKERQVDLCKSEASLCT